MPHTSKLWQLVATTHMHNHDMPDRCPDCGHTNIRPADQSEQQEFLMRKTDDVWSEEPI